MIQIFDLGPKIRRQKKHSPENPRQNSQLINDPLCFQNPRNRSIYRKNPPSVRFLRPNPSIRKPLHPLVIVKLVISECLIYLQYVIILVLGELLSWRVIETSIELAYKPI